MRLGQFSRKYEVKSTEVVDVLGEYFRTVINHPNVKLTEEELSFLEKHFQSNTSRQANPTPPHISEADATEESVLVASSDSSQVTEGEPSEAQATTEEVVEETNTTITDIPAAPKVISLEKEYEEQTKDVETIPTEKPQLEGLRVLGKIDIPETKPSKSKNEKNEGQTKSAIKNVAQKKPRKKVQKQGLSLEEQRQRKERMAWKKKQQEQKRLKEKRRLHYEKQLLKKKEEQKAQKTKNQHQKSTEKVIPPQPKVTTAKQVKKGKIKRFWQWLNGAYDDI